MGDRSSDGGTGGPRRWAALALLCAAQFVDVLDVNVVVVALPSIGRELGFSGQYLQWVVSAYVLVFAGFLLLAGRVADLFGRRRVFMVGLALFGGASLACGLAGSQAALLVARALQGLGAAVVAPAALSIITTTFVEVRERNLALGVWTAVAACGGAAGLVIGGVVTDWIGWEWIFFINVPITAVALLLAPVLLQDSRDAAASRRLDVPGAATATAGLVLLVYGLTRSEETGFRDAGTAGALVLGLAFVGMFLIIERRVEDPLVPFKIFRSRSLVGANLAAFANTATTSSVGVLVTIYLQDVLRYSPTSAGFAGLPFSLLVVVGSFLGSWMAGRIGTRYTMAAGLAGISVSTLLVTGISADHGLGLVLANAALTGVCLGCSAVASTAAGTSAARADEQGLVSGLLNTAAQVGTAMGLAVLFTIAAARTDALSGGAKPTAEALVAGYHWAFHAGAGVAALGVVCALSLVREKGV